MPLLLSVQSIRIDISVSVSGMIVKGGYGMEKYQRKSGRRTRKKSVRKGNEETERKRY